MRDDETLTVRPAQAQGTAMASEQQRAIAQVQAQMIIARTNPRDQIRALDLIRQDCTRPGLAERGLYTYAKGGTDVTGPSIRLAECIAMRWTNVEYGICELDQRDGESVIQAFAVDLETNVRRSMTFTVPHARDTKKGRVEVSDARSIYEITANMGARRVRACILGIIPGDIVEAAVEQVELTLKTKAEVTPERVTKMLELFASYGVTRDQIERRIQRRATVETLTPALLLQLGKIANSLRDGMSSPGDWFDAIDPVTGASKPVSAVTTSDVMASALSAGWTTKDLLDFLRKMFGKELTALERGDECAAAVHAIVAETTQRQPRAKKKVSASPSPSPAS